jgi:hypothetical protein
VVAQHVGAEVHQWLDSCEHAARSVICSGVDGRSASTFSIALEHMNHLWFAMMYTPEGYSSGIRRESFTHHNLNSSITFATRQETLIDGTR